MSIEISQHDGEEIPPERRPNCPLVTTGQRTEGLSLGSMTGSTGNTDNSPVDPRAKHPCIVGTSDRIGHSGGR